MNRRHYLSIGAVAATSSLNGCTLLTNTPLFDATVQLVDVYAQNHYQEERSATVRVLDGDTEIQTSELELEPAERGDGYISPGSDHVDCAWENEPKAFGLEIETVDAERTVDVADRASDDCVFVAIALGQSGSPQGDIHVATHSCEDFEGTVEDEAMCEF